MTDTLAQLEAYATGAELAHMDTTVVRRAITVLKAQASRIAELEGALRMVRPFAPPDTEVARAVSKALEDKTLSNGGGS
jgi:hypothetical protein